MQGCNKDRFDDGKDALEAYESDGAFCKGAWQFAQWLYAQYESWWTRLDYLTNSAACGCQLTKRGYAEIARLQKNERARAAKKSKVLGV